VKAPRAPAFNHNDLCGSGLKLHELTSKFMGAGRGKKSASRAAYFTPVEEQNMHISVVMQVITIM
jgi:hypothetical protein